MIIRIDRILIALAVTGLLAACATMEPSPLPPNNPANPQAGESNAPSGFLTADATSHAIANRLKESPVVAEIHGGQMPGMQHDGMHMKEPGPGTAPMKQEPPAPKALDEEMKKTSDEMKQTSEALKQKASAAPAAFFYTCPMHLQIHQDKPGKCPICGMDLVRKESQLPK